MSKLLNKTLQIPTNRHSFRNIKRRRSPRTTLSNSTNNNEAKISNNNLLNIQGLCANQQQTATESSASTRPQHPQAFVNPPNSLPNLFRMGPNLRAHRFTTPPQQNTLPDQLIFPRFPPAFGTPPPVTVLVPYPMIIPLPIPIPIIIPLPICKNSLDKMKDNSNVEKNTNETNTTLDSPNLHDSNINETEPLDLGKREQTSNDGPNSPMEGNLSNIKDENAEQKLPKFKITRLASKRILNTKESDREKTRPLRKRKFDQHQIVELDTSKQTAKF